MELEIRSEKSQMTVVFMLTLGSNQAPAPHDELSELTQGGRYGRQHFGPASRAFPPPGQDIVDLWRTWVLALASLLFLGPFRADGPRSGRACWLCCHGQRGGWAAGWTRECCLWL